MWVWAYGTTYSCGPEMEFNLLSLPAVFVVIPILSTLLLSVCMRVHWLLKAGSRAYLNACIISWLIASLRELRFERSSVFRRKLLADGKLH
jgi:hypothetical protein